jgi:hypothetical protein
MQIGTLLFAGIRAFLIGPPVADGSNQARPNIKHINVYAEIGRFGGWPANHGIWAWGDEILVGFSAGYFKDNGPNLHNIDPGRRIAIDPDVLFDRSSGELI